MRMTDNRRILLNIMATYGRSLYVLVIGLFCGRWALRALGEIDYGLVGVVGGLSAFVAFLNGIMATGVARFYAISVGLAKHSPDVGMDTCRKWFTTAVIVHSILPIILVVIGYPIGCWFVRGFLTIPVDRVECCIWVWRFACVSCFAGMVSVPFVAMYNAKQEIAELTVYSFITSTVNVIFLYYAITHPGDWLVRYSAWTCAIAITPLVIISVRSPIKYKECRFRLKYINCIKEIKGMVSYCGWLAIGALAALMRSQGVAVLINKFLGPSVNAAMSVGTTMATHCTSLTGSIVGAFSPAIMNAYGAGNMATAKALANRLCKIGLLMLLVFAVPLIIEINEVVLLWLGTPPRYAAGLCVCVLIMMIVDKSSVGHMIIINAKGKMAMYQSCVGGVVLLTIPLGWLFLSLGGNVYYVGATMVCTTACGALVRVIFASKLVGMSMKEWICKIIAPLIPIVTLSCITGLLPTVLMRPSLFRVVITTAIVESVFLPMAWLFLLDKDERAYLRSKTRYVCERFMK